MRRQKLAAAAARGAEPAADADASDANGHAQPNGVDTEHSADNDDDDADAR